MFAIHPLDEAGARAAALWRYEPPYTIYQIDLVGDALEEAVRFLTNPSNAYYRIDNADGELEAFCCFGDDAQVSGGDYSADALDLGLGVHPELTGQGRGSLYVQATIDFALRNYQPMALRVTVATFNTRAQRVWQKAGFHQVSAFLSAEQRGFLILMREAGKPHEYP
jgi:[ribosomal protein S18]-alanine N-acetyltransferase